MSEKLKAYVIKGLKPREKAYEIYDSELPGFLVRVQPTGTRVYYAAYRRKDCKRGRVRLGSAKVLTSRQAREKAKRILADVAMGNDPTEARQLTHRYTLRTFLDKEYGPWVTANRKTGGETLARVKSAFANLLKVKLDDIGAWQIEKWQAQRLNFGRTLATCDREIAALKAALAKAVEHHEKKNRRWLLLWRTRARNATAEARTP